MADLKAFAEHLVHMTTKEVSHLAQVLKEEYGIEAAAAAVVAENEAIPKHKGRQAVNFDYRHEQESFRRREMKRNQKVSAVRKGKTQNFRRR